MKLLTAILKELLGLFVDDGLLAIEIIVVVVVAAVASYVLPESLATGAILLFGCLGALLMNVRRAR